MPGWFSSRAFLLLATTQQKARCFTELQDLPLLLSWLFLASLCCSFDFSVYCFAEKRRIPFVWVIAPKRKALANRCSEGFVYQTAEKT